MAVDETVATVVNGYNAGVRAALNMEVGDLYGGALQHAEACGIARGDRAYRPFVGGFLDAIEARHPVIVTDATGRIEAIGEPSPELVAYAAEAL